MKKIQVVVTFIFLICCSIAANASDVISIDNLKCEMLTNTIGIDATTPRFSWQINTEARGTKQLAYQIIVSSSVNKLLSDEGDLWNSGQINSDQSIQVAYAGKPLQSRQECFWKVKVWTNHNQES